jgi:hypothetical protein
MPERYPDDVTLLTLDQDPDTGVEYIPTGRSPYYLEFRRLVQRTLVAAARANDLRLYQDGDLAIGVRPGRCLIRGAPLEFAGVSAVSVAPGVVTQFWIDDAGRLQSGDDLPVDRGGFIPLATVTAGASAIDTITDLRGEVFLAAPNLLGSTTTQFQQAGNLTTSLTNRLAGVAPISGKVEDIILTLGMNMASSVSTDGVAATAKVNGNSLATTDPKITSAAGAGFQSTRQGGGTAAVIKSDGTEGVRQGDLLTVDVTRTATGTVSVEAGDVVVLIVIRPTQQV